MAPPLKIGITFDHNAPGGYSKFPWYALRENYCSSISDLGALPIPLSHEMHQVEHWLELIDGLIITGGDFDINPSLYGANTQHETVTVKERRTQFEWAMTKGALAMHMPILGICGGEQLLNVILGGTLIQHIPDSVPNCLAHEQPNPRDEVGHAVKIIEGTQLHQIVGKTDIMVNSAHHQAVETLAPACVLNAIAPDGVIEGFEYTEHPFCLGIEWHPEFSITEADRHIYAAFVRACAS